MSLWCSHREQTSPRRDEVGEYRRCLECGARLAWAWPDKFPLRPPRRTQPLSWETFCSGLEMDNRVAARRS